MKFSRLRFGLLAGVILAVLAAPTMAQLLVTVQSSGTVIGQTKEASFSVNGAVTAFGSTTLLPACAAALASSPIFTDLTAYSINWGTSLQSTSDYETFFCIANIGSSAGIIHVTVSSTDGATYTVEQCQQGVAGLTFSVLDGATIAGNGVIAVRAHIHTPTVALNGSVALNGKYTFTFS